MDSTTGDGERTVHLPPLPKIEGDVDIIMDIYTHSSLNHSSGELNNEYGDADRLADLGEQAMLLYTTKQLHSLRPPLPASTIQTRRTELLGTPAYEIWFRHYNIDKKFKFSREITNPIHISAMHKSCFNAYIGAVYLRNGSNVARDFIVRLVDPENPPAPPSPSAHPPPHDARDFSQPPHPGSPPYPYTHYTQTPMQPPGSPPPMPPPSQEPSQGYGGIPSMPSPMITLALVNQTAAQAHIALTYNATQSGPSHMPTWQAECLANGTVCGRGAGKTQKLAKEEAARQAWVNLGWGR